jgi:hypothetical protein
MEYGIFNDEGLLEGNFYSYDEAENARELRYPEEDAEVHEVCPEHEDERRDVCPHCNYEED